MNTVIRKTAPLKDPPPNLRDYAAARASFSWDAVARDLGVPLAGPMNLASLALSRGGGLVWYGARGETERLSSQDLAEQSARFAGALAGLGIRQGDRVAFLSRALPELAVALLATLHLGAVAVVLGRTRNANALRNMLETTGCAAALVEPDAQPILDGVRGSLPALKTVVLLPRGPAAAPRPGDLTWDAACRAAAPAAAVPLPADAPAYIHFSDVGMSGAAVAQRAAFPLASSAALALDLRAGDGLVAVGLPGDPLFLPYCILAPLLLGATSHLMEDPVRGTRFSSFPDPVHVWFSSTRAIDVLLRTEPDLGRLLAGCRHIAVTHPYEAPFVAMTEVSYGSPLHATWWPRELATIQTAEFRACDLRVGSIGRPLPGVELALDPGSGRLSVRAGPAGAFAGYWGDPEQTARRVRKEWFVTEQRAKMDSDGYAWIIA